MESPIAPVEMNTDLDEAVYPCKGCGEVLEEGKAFELAGNRWHLDCFRCHHCGTILDSESNLLLLGDGSLICNNCTYSCHACGNKIEDLAILTGDLAFCASCFKCRNCKRKIDNLKYARTSQGIFCMQCHESLMARRRKKARNQRPRDPSAASNGSNGRVEKQLPAIPPTNSTEQTNGQRSVSGSQANTPTVRSPDIGAPPGVDRPSNVGSPLEEQKDFPTISQPAKTIDKRTSTVSNREEGDGDFFIPVALDTSPQPPYRSPPLNQSLGGQKEFISPPLDSGKSSVYTDPLSSAGAPRSGSRDRLQRSKPSPHIAYQEKGRQPSSDAGEFMRKRTEFSAPTTGSSVTSPSGVSQTRPPIPVQSNDFDKSGFKLEEAPKTKRTSGSQGGSMGTSPNLALASQTEGSALLEQSVAAANSARATQNTDDLPDRSYSTTSAPGTDSITGENQVGPTEDPPPRSSSRPLLQQPATSANGEFTAPRDAPQPPRHKQNESLGSIQSERFQTKHPTTPVSGFDNDDGTPGADDEEDHSGLFRKMSKAVKHGRSYSDKLGPSSPKQRSTRNDSIDISSPIQTPGDPKEEIISLRNQLKFQKQRVAELEAEKNALEEEVNGTVNIRKATADLKEKRNTIAFLDSQKEMFVRELDVMADYASKLKEWPRNKQLNVEDVKTELMADLSRRMSTLRDSLSTDIEQLVQQKNDLTNEISNLIQMKDKGFQEYESLSTKNAQLNDLNGQLVRNIQELYKQGRDPAGANGLGIYTNDKSGAASIDGRSLVSADASQLSGDTEVEPAVLSAPHLVNIRKGGQPKKFNWKKSAKNVGKGLGFKAAFTNSSLKEEQSAEGMAYGDMPAGESPTVVTTLPRQGTDPSKQSWGQFLTGAKPNERGGLKPGPIQREPSQSSMNSLSASEAMFGSDLTARCEFEKRLVPTIVTRCIDEVEKRGMNMEGIYRKSGSSTQVKQLQAGMEKDPSGFDISDPDLDIHSVTGMMKQYFRKLPTPLLTFSVYESFLEVGNSKDWTDAQRVERLRYVIKNLPRCHRDTLQVLVGHLIRVVEQHGENLMTPLNLAVVFAPTITRPESIEREMSDMQAQRTAVQHLLELHREVFAVE